MLAALLTAPARLQGPGAARGRSRRCRVVEQQRPELVVGHRGDLVSARIRGTVQQDSTEVADHAVRHGIRPCLADHGRGQCRETECSWLPNTAAALSQAIRAALLLSWGTQELGPSWKICGTRRSGQILVSLLLFSGTCGVRATASPGSATRLRRGHASGGRPRRGGPRLRPGSCSLMPASSSISRALSGAAIRFLRIIQPTWVKPARSSDRMESVAVERCVGHYVELSAATTARRQG